MWYTVYDKKGNVTRTIKKEEENSLQASEEYLRVVTCFVISSDGYILIEERANSGLNPGEKDLCSGHVEDKDAVFKELYRVLDNEGELLFSVGHPMRFATEKINYNNTSYHVIGFEAGNNGNHILGKYMSHTKQINYFKDNEVLEEFIAPPSYFFEILLNNH